MSVWNWAVIVLIAEWLAIAFVLRVIAVGVIPGNRKPSTGMAWLLLILLAPIVGFLIFLLVGRADIGRDRHARQLRAKARIRERRGEFSVATLVKKLNATKIQWRPMLPIMPLKGRFGRPDLRNHRKLLVVDGAVGFMGSLNLIERGYKKPKNHRVGRKWVECMVCLHGQIVAALDDVFAVDWYAESDEILAVSVHPARRADAVRGVPCQLVPSGPGFVAENNLRRFTALIYSATRRISIASPYFVSDESLLYAITTAAQRGIEVELFVSELSDQFMVRHAQCSYYRALLEVGVRIYLYPAPYILHSKHFSIDDDVVMIESSNIDMRSFALNYEISLMVLGGSVVLRLRTVEDTYRELSRELLLEEWLRRRPGLRFIDNAMRLTSALD